jgi:hypothetical protein
MQSMSIAKKFFSALGVLVIASSVVPSTTAHAETVVGNSNGFVFCSRANITGAVSTTAPSYITNAQAAVGSGSGFIAKSPQGVSGGQCINTAAITLPVFARHTTTFDLTNAGAPTNVVVQNTNPVATMTTMCVAPNTDAIFRFTDAENDTVTLTSFGALNGNATVEGNNIRFTPTYNYTGSATVQVNVNDSATFTPLTATTAAATEIVPSTTTPPANQVQAGNGFGGGTATATISSGNSGQTTTLNIQVSNSCPASSSSMSSSMSSMSSSMSSMSSSMMSSSMDSSMMSSSMSSSSKSSSMMSSAPVVVYVEVPVSGKGMTIRTGANN